MVRYAQIILLLFLCTPCIGQFVPLTHPWGVQIGINGDPLDTVKVEGLNLNFYNSGNIYTAGISSPDTLYNITFQDITGAYQKTLNGNLTRTDVDKQVAAYDIGWPTSFKSGEIANGENWAYFVGGLSGTYTWSEIRIDDEIHKILSISNDTAYADDVWAASTDTYLIRLEAYTIKNLNSDSLRYGTIEMENLSKTRVYNEVRVPFRVNDQHYIASKKGGVIWRHDNWVGEWNTSMTAMLEWQAVLDKYNIKVTTALNSQRNAYWIGDYVKYKKFWRDMQAQGHEVVDHTPTHENHSYTVLGSNRIATADMPGVLRIGIGVTVDTVYCDTISGYGGIGDALVTNDGFDIMRKRALRMFDFIGLNRPTYHIEGGGLSVYQNPDSIYDYSWQNGFIGGGKYNSTYYKHMGFNPPLNWVGKSEYFMDWASTESISLVASGASYGTRNYTATEAIKKTVDQSAKHALTIFRQHVQNRPSDRWYLECMDSICSFMVRYPHYIRNWTGSQAAKIMYQSETNPYLNIMPSLDVNIDSIWGDTMPDGWTIGSEAAYWEAMTGSQGSLGCVSVNTTEANNLYLTRLYGVEKGTNTFTIDIKDKGANDTVYIEFTYYTGANYQGLSGTEIQLAFPSTADWVTNTDDVTFPYNTSFIDIQIWSRSDESYVDELTLKKKYGIRVSDTLEAETGIFDPASGNARISIVSDVGDTAWFSFVDGGANPDTVVIEGDPGLAFRWGNNSLIVGPDGHIYIEGKLHTGPSGTMDPDPQTHIGNFDNDLGLLIKPHSAGTGDRFEIRDENDVVEFVVKDNGNVGIGTNTPTGGKVHIEKSLGGSLIMYLHHAGTASNSNSNLFIQTEGAVGGDPTIRFSIGDDPTPLSDWSIGIDNSDSDKFKISNGSKPQTDTRLTIDGLGTIDIPGTVNIADTLNVADLTILGNQLKRVSGNMEVVAEDGTLYLDSYTTDVQISAGTGGSTNSVTINPDNTLVTPGDLTLKASVGDPISLNFNDNLDVTKGYLRFTDDVADGDLALFAEGPLSITSNDNIALYGNVGIGIATPIDLLHVDGNIRANRFIMDRPGETQSSYIQRGVSGVAKGISFYTVNNHRMIIREGGNIGIGTELPTALLDINSNIIRLRTTKTPASASAVGNAGDICWDTDYIYICIATNTWRRIAHSTW